MRISEITVIVKTREISIKTDSYGLDEDAGIYRGNDLNIDLEDLDIVHKIDYTRDDGIRVNFYRFYARNGESDDIIRGIRAIKKAVSENIARLNEDYRNESKALEDLDAKIKSIVRRT